MRNLSRVTCDPTPSCYIVTGSSWRAEQEVLGGRNGRKLSDTAQLKLRFSEALRRRLEREARRQEHSLNGEIINRLEQSFRKSEDADLLGSTLRALFGGATGDLLRAIATAIWLIEKSAGKKWHEDRETTFQVSHAIGQIIDWFAGGRDPARHAALLKYRDLSILPPGQSAAAANAAALETLRKMGVAPSDAEIDQAAAKIRADNLELKERFGEVKIVGEPFLVSPKTKDEGEGP